MREKLTLAKKHPLTLTNQLRDLSIVLSFPFDLLLLDFFRTPSRKVTPGSFRLVDFLREKFMSVRRSP